MSISRKSAAAALLSVMIVLSSCGQSTLPTAPQATTPSATPAQTTLAQNPAQTLSAAAQANEERTLTAAAGRGLNVLSKVTLESDAGVPTTYLEAVSAQGAPVTLIGSVEGGVPVFAELRAVPEGMAGTAGSPFSITSLTAQGTVNTAMSVQGVSDWVYRRLVDLVEQYKKAPRWLKAALRGPLKGVIKLIIGEAINRGCNYAYDTLVRKLRMDGRWVPLGRALLCEILLG